MSDDPSPERKIVSSGEDQRTAVNISVNLSSYVVTAALAMLAVVGAFATYLMDKRETGVVFWIALAVSVLAFVASIVSGGNGIARSYRRGYNGDWSLAYGSTYFDWQAKLCFLGLLAFFVLFVGTKSKQDETAQAVRDLQSAIELSIKTRQMREHNPELQIIQRQRDSLELSRGSSPPVASDHQLRQKTPR